MPGPAATGEEAVAFEAGGLRVTAFLAHHEPAGPAYGYAVEFGGRKVVLSGDGRCEAELARASQGADALVVAATSKRLTAMAAKAWGAAADAQQQRLAAMLRDTLGYHCGAEDAVALARASGSKLLLTHTVPPVSNPLVGALYLQGVDTAGVDVAFAHDGSHLRLPRHGPVEASRLPMDASFGR